jgi:hypothetical protein
MFTSDLNNCKGLYSNIHILADWTFSKLNVLKTLVIFPVQGTQRNCRFIGQIKLCITVRSVVLRVKFCANRTLFVLKQDFLWTQNIVNNTKKQIILDKIEAIIKTFITHFLIRKSGIYVTIRLNCISLSFLSCLRLCA